MSQRRPVQESQMMDCGKELLPAAVCQQEKQGYRVRRETDRAQQSEELSTAEGERETRTVKQVDIFPDPLGGARLGNYGNTRLQVPSQDDLCGCCPVFGRHRQVGTGYRPASSLAHARTPSFASALDRARPVYRQRVRDRAVQAAVRAG